MSFPQRCKVCEKRDKFDFHVADEVWAQVVPEPYRNRVVCLGCFDAFASQKGVRFAGAMLNGMTFAGDAAHLALQIRGFVERPG